MYWYQAHSSPACHDPTFGLGRTEPSGPSPVDFVGTSRRGQPISWYDIFGITYFLVDTRFADMLDRQLSRSHEGATGGRPRRSGERRTLRASVLHPTLPGRLRAPTRRALRPASADSDEFGRGFRAKAATDSD